MYRMTDVHDSPIVAGARAVPRCMGPTFGCPSMLPSAHSSSCRCSVFEVLRPMHVGLLQTLIKSLQHYHYHYNLGDRYRGFLIQITHH